MIAAWSGNAVRKARDHVATWLPAPCGQCGTTVTPRDRWVIGHIKPRITHPELTWEISNWQVEHRACSDKTSQAAVIAKAKQDALVEHGVSTTGTPTSSDFSQENDSAQPPNLPVHTLGVAGEPLEVREALSWSVERLSAAPWLSDVLTVPGDAAVPLAMTPVHPRATGSYGWDAIDWVREHLKVELRWWQKLAFVRQLEHDADGALVWRVIVESCPRRAGKSVRLRAMALWRVAHWDLFGERQLVIHTGKDREIVKEIHRQAWQWAIARGWVVRRGAGQEEIAHTTEEAEHRWLVRSTEQVYGYDTTLGMVDEAWAVEPGPFDEGLEPSTMERLSPQLLLTSTAHRRATSLMPRRVANALAAEDGETLLLLWGARPQDDPGAEETWRAASPHWSEDRRRMIAAKHVKALAGEVDPTADDPDPMAGFVAQYTNVWRLRAAKPDKGDSVVTEDAWTALVEPPPLALPDAVAVESWFADGVSVALGWRQGTQAVVSVSDHPDLTAAVAAVKESGYRGTVTVGSSLADDPALKGIRVKAGEGRVAAAVTELDRLLTEDGLRHDAGDHLTGQVLAVRTQPGPDGARVVSRGRADAIKAAVWAAGKCRATGRGDLRIVLPASVRRPAV